MEKARLREMARPAFFSARLRFFLGLWIARPRFRPQNGFAKKFETARH